MKGCHGRAGFEELIVRSVLAFGLELLALILGLLAGTVRGHLHFTLAMTCIATVSAIEALRAQTPNPLST